MVLKIIQAQISFKTLIIYYFNNLPIRSLITNYSIIHVFIIIIKTIIFQLKIYYII